MAKKLNDPLGLATFTGIVAGAVEPKKADAEIDIDLIDVVQQVRREFHGIDEMKDSILQHGILNPLIVHAEDGGRFRLVCGERRYRGARKAGLTTVKVNIKKGLSEAQIRALQVAENVDTETLSPFDEVTGVAEDISKYGHAEAAKIWNRKASWISKRASFHTFAPELQELMAEGVCQDLEVLGSIQQLKKTAGGEAYAKSVIAKFKRGETVSRDGVRELVARVKTHEKAQAEAKKGGDLFASNVPAKQGEFESVNAKKLHKVRTDLNKTGQLLLEQFLTEQALMASMGHTLEQGEWVLWSSFQTVLLPVLHSLSKDRAAAYLRRLSTELKSKTTLDLYLQLHGGENIKSPTESAPGMPEGWDFGPA